MIAVRVEIAGAGILARRLQAIGRRSREAVRDALAHSARELEHEIKRSILDNPRRGPPYVRGHPTRTGRASAPGDPPADDLGQLARDVTLMIDADGYGATVESRAAHSRFLEFGTAEMAARPFMFPAFERHRARIVKRIAAALRGAAGV